MKSSLSPIKEAGNIRMGHYSEAKRAALSHFASGALEARTRDKKRPLRLAAPVEGIGIGEEKIRVYIRQGRKDIDVPPAFEGIPSEIVSTVGFRADAPTRARHVSARPTPCGVSVAHYNVSAGTLGCLVELPDKTRCILSNSHVLAEQNRARKGDRILQPGPHDGGKSPCFSLATTPGR